MMDTNHTKLKRCPICKHHKFHVPVEVSQTWEADGNGILNHIITTCDEVIKRPDDETIWTCAKCGYAAKGREFNLVGSPVKHFNIVLSTDNGKPTGTMRIDAFSMDIQCMKAIRDSVRDFLKTEKGREFTDEKSVFNWNDLKKIPDDIFRTHDIAVVFQEPFDIMVSENENLRTY